MAGASNWLSSGFGGPELEKLGLKNSFVAKPGAKPSFLAPAKGDYKLNEGNQGIASAGTEFDEHLLKMIGGKLYEYRAGQERQARPVKSPPDVGAYGFVPK